MSSRLLLGLLSALAVLLVAAPAQAWVEMHIVAYEARVEVGRQGTAKVDHLLRLRVGGGPLRMFDLKILDRNVALAEEAWLVNSREGLTAKVPIPVRLEQRPDGDLRVEIDGKRGVGRGTYELRFAYTIDLLRQEGLESDGSMLRVQWTSPKLDDGIDNMKTTLVIPAAPTEPRPATTRVGGQGEDGTIQETGTFLTTVSRTPQADEISLLRPHVAKREPVVWAVRIDPRALGDLNDPRLRPPPAPQEASGQAISARDRATWLSVLAAGAFLYALLLALKNRDVTRFSALRSVDPRPLIPVGIAVRVALAGPLLAGGVAWQLQADNPLWGSLLVLAAVLFTSFVPSRRGLQVRGPGRWLPLSKGDSRSNASVGSSWLDASTWPGRVVLLLCLTGLGVGVWQVAQLSRYHAHLVALDGVVLLALFGTGLRRWLPGDLVFASSEVLNSVSSHLRSLKNCKLVQLGRIPTGASMPDEVRLSIRVKDGLRGLVAIEVGVGWFQGAGGPIALPQVLLRVADQSPCHQAITERMPGARWVRGRESQERVLVLSSTLPTADCVARLVQRLTVWVTEAPERKPVAPTRTVRRSVQPRAAASSTRMSSGRSASTEKPRNEPVPCQDRW